MVETGEELSLQDVEISSRIDSGSGLVSLRIQRCRVDVGAQSVLHFTYRLPYLEHLAHRPIRRRGPGPRENLFDAGHHVRVRAGDIAGLTEVVR